MSKPNAIAIPNKNIDELLELLRQATEPQVVILASDTLEDVRGKALLVSTYYAQNATSLVMKWRKR